MREILVYFHISVSRFTRTLFLPVLTGFLHCVSDIPNFSLILVFYVVHASTDASNKAYILKMLDGVAGARQSVVNIVQIDFVQKANRVQC